MLIDRLLKHQEIRIWRQQGLGLAPNTVLRPRSTEDHCDETQSRECTRQELYHRHGTGVQLQSFCVTEIADRQGSGRTLYRVRDHVVIGTVSVIFFISRASTMHSVYHAPSHTYPVMLKNMS